MFSTAILALSFHLREWKKASLNERKSLAEQRLNTLKPTMEQHAHRQCTDCLDGSH